MNIGRIRREIERPSVVPIRIKDWPKPEKPIPAPNWPTKKPAKVPAKSR